MGKSLNCRFTKLFFRLRMLVTPPGEWKGSVCPQCRFTRRAAQWRTLSASV